MSQVVNKGGIEKGDIVYWYPGGVVTQDPHPAIVTAIGYDSLNLNICEPQSYNFHVRDGVRHVDDKRAKQVELQEAGGWDYTPRHKRFLVLEKQVNDLLAELGKKGK